MRGGWKYAVMVRTGGDQEIVRIKCYRANQFEDALKMMKVYQRLVWVEDAWLVEYA